jgi:NAD(P)-dependent dehydrogenase (short-subunit alcohol dehydrogenase family)
MDLGLRDRACIVTGGSKGLGLAIAQGLVAEGARVLIVARHEPELEQAAGRIGAAWHAADLRDPDAPEAVIAAARRWVGGVDVLVNNAGIAEIADIDEESDEQWQRDWELHVMAAMRLMRAACPLMADQGWGRVVNVSSSSGKRPSGTLALSYSVTKAGLLALSRGFADRYAARGVRINAIAPGMALSEGWTEAGGLADQLAARRGGTREEVLQAQGERLPIGRALTPEEVAQIAVVLCSEAASGVAGAAWSVDGGIWASIV